MIYYTGLTLSHSNSTWINCCFIASNKPIFNGKRVLSLHDMPVLGKYFQPLLLLSSPGTKMKSILHSSPHSHNQKAFLLTGVMALLLIMLPLTTCLAQEAKELVKQGDFYYGKKDYKRALQTFLSALEINPDDAEVNLKVRMPYLYSDTKSRAAVYIDKADRLNPNINDATNYHLGIAFQNTNEFQKAIDQFEQFKKKRSKLASI